MIGLESVIGDLANRGYQVIGPTLRADARIARERLRRALSHLSVDHFREHFAIEAQGSIAAGGALGEQRHIVVVKVDATATGARRVVAPRA